MSNWITGRRPTSDEANEYGEVLTHEVGSTYWGCVSSLWHWMECPPLPEAEPTPRTLEDVVREYLQATRHRPDFHAPREWQDLRDEMKEILQKGQDNE